MITIIDATSPADPPGSSVIEVLDAEDVLGVATGSDILVVDDDPATLAAYEAALSPLGRRVVVAESGMQALAKLLDQDFALLLLDVSMPEMSGLDVARQIRQRPRNKGLPIIFITGMDSSTNVMLEAYGLGALDFVAKPILPEVLRAKARVYLQLQERTRALVRESAELREAHRKLIAADERVREVEREARAAHRLQKLQDATAALAQASTPGEVAAVAVQLGAEAVGATTANMWVVRADGSLALEASHGVPEDFIAPWRVIDGTAPGAVTRTLHTGQPIWVENAADYERESPEAFLRARAANRIWAFALLPLIRNGRGIGVLSFGFAGEHAFAGDERRFLTGLAQLCEQVLDRSRYHVAEGEARRSAEDANRRKDEFLAMLSHELRNPLWTMVNALEAIKARAPLAGELAVMGRQIDHLTHIVGDLLDVSRVTRGKIELRREPVALGAVIAESLETARPAIEQRAHRVTVDVPGDLLVDADRHRLRQVLDNVLDNAVKYTDRGHIAVAASAEGDHVRITVRDDGRGIAPELLPQVFDPFVQGEQPLDRSEGGLGIGLTLAEAVVELHGGTIEAHSEGPGTGATFTLRWPAAPGLEPGAPPSEPPVRPAGRRILIVDDNADAADMLAMLLRGSGHEVTVVHDGAAALAIAPVLAPEVALLDIGLPVIDGLQLARRLRQIEACRDTLLIAVTGYGQPGDRQRTREAGFAHHLVKPVMVKTIEALLARPPG